MQKDNTYIGRISKVVGANVTVDVTNDLPSISPIIDGRLYRVGQVGSFVRIPVGAYSVFGIVSTVGSAAPNTLIQDDHFPARWLEVQVFGESLGLEQLKRGVTAYPTLDDEVHILTPADAAVVFGTSSPAHIYIGHHTSASNYPAALNASTIVNRHLCIVGATGSGKSNTVARVLNELTNGRFPSARIVLIDPHGEYATAFPANSKVLRIGDPVNPLHIPFWAMTFDELTWLLVDRRPGSETPQDAILRDQILELKRKNAPNLKAGPVSSSDITVDAPIPFDLRDLWYIFDRADRVTYEDKERTKEALIAEGSSVTLKAAEFKPHSPYNQAPWKGQTSVPMGAYVTRIYNRLRDQRFQFLLSPGEYDGQAKDLGDLLQGWIGHTHPLTVFDLSNAPFEVMDVAVGAITRILYDTCFWGRTTEAVGRNGPVFLVYEESHSYLSGQDSRWVQGYARRAAQRVFKEGRKYGIGACLVSQRPSELDDTLLSQCGTYVAMRLNNGTDQGQIKTLAPDGMPGLLDLLPALRTGEALVLGEAVEFPYRIQVDQVPNRPDSRDPQAHELWTNPRSCPNFDRVVTGWRQQQLPPPIGSQKEVDKKDENGAS